MVIPMIALHRVEYTCMYVIQLVAYNNFEQTIFGHFAQEVLGARTSNGVGVLKLSMGWGCGRSVHERVMVWVWSSY